MKRTVLVLILGVMLGAAAGYGLSRQDSGLVLEDGRFAERPRRDLVERDGVTAEAVETMREARFSTVRTIEDTLALPTDFAETEALYVLAGRSNASELQDLIYQAARIREQQDRNYAISILLGRLTELDPRSAVAIAASPLLEGRYPHERQVWVAWARLDFDAALDAARETSGERRHRVAQALYSSQRQVDPLRDDSIFEVLGARVSPEVLSERVAWLAEESPADAVRYIESLTMSSAQRRAVQALAASLSGRLASDGQSAARAVADLFGSPALRMQFLNGVRYQASQHDPEAVLSELQASGKLRGPRGVDQALSAIGQLAMRDPERARAFVDQLDGVQAKYAIQSVAFMMAEVDPAGTLEWVRARDDSPDQLVLVGVLTQLASSNPELALTEVESIGNPVVRERAVAGIVQTAATVDPEKASTLLTMLDNSPYYRRQALRQIATQWATMDLDGALAWQSRLPEEERSRVLQQMADSLVYTDIDAAMTLLPGLDEAGARGLASTIVGALGQQRSYDEAMAFVDRYRGQPVYDGLKIQAITSLAASDPDRAMAVLRGMQRTGQHDQVIGHIAQRAAATDPDKALRWSDGIADENVRSHTRATIVQNWLANDPARALQWFNALPAGAERDNIAAAAASSLGKTDPQAARQLLDNIGDPALRSQALANYAMETYASDPVTAERLLNEADIDPAMREQYLEILRQSRSAAVW